jgi:cytochrome P450
MPARAGQPPGPPLYPYIGNTFLLRGDPLGTLTRWAREYGDVIYYRLFNQPMYILSHPQDIEQVLLGNPANFTKGLTSSVNPELFGTGLLTSDGEFWRRQRRLANPAFHRENIARYAGIALEEADRVMLKWRAGEIRDIHQDMMGATLAIVLRSLFGVELQDKRHAIEPALDAIMHNSSGIRAVASFLRIPTLARRAFLRAVDRLNGVVYELIAHGKERLKQESGSARVQNDLLTMLLMARDDDGNAMTDQQLRDEVITLLLAGHETTALNLSWTWYLLSMHAEAEQRLHEELDRVVGDRAVEPGDLGTLPYLECVLRESLRLYPPAWRIFRTTDKPFNTANFVLPPGANLVLSQWVTHRDARWFPEPERFDPDRWAEKAAARLPRFAYFPFGGGPRVCIGAGFAMMEATLLVAAIAQRFRLRVVAGQRIEPLASITLRPKNGIRVELQPRVAGEASGSARVGDKRKRDSSLYGLRSE